jgi:hypothetical protein
MIEEYIERAGTGAIRFKGLDNAVIGIDHKGRLVYDYFFICDIFMNELNMNEEDIVEWVDYNVLGTMAGDGFVIVYR